MSRLPPDDPSAHPVTPIQRRSLLFLLLAAGAGAAWFMDVYSVDRPLVDGRPNLALCLASVPFVALLARAVETSYAGLFGLRLASRDRTEAVVVWTAQLRLFMYLAMVPAVMLAGVRHRMPPAPRNATANCRKAS